MFLGFFVGNMENERRKNMRLIDADKIDFGEIIKGDSEFAKDIREAVDEVIRKQPSLTPCSIGDTIYWIDLLGNIIEEKVAEFTIGVINENGKSPIGYFGANLYATREEAEAKRQKRKEK